MKAFSALLVFAICPILASAQQPSIHDEIDRFANLNKSYLQANSQSLVLAIVLDDLPNK